MVTILPFGHDPTVHNASVKPLTHNSYLALDVDTQIFGCLELHNAPLCPPAHNSYLLPVDTQMLKRLGAVDLQMLK